MKTAVIYARYSSDKQTEQSIEGQLRVCNDYANRNKILVVGTYIDRATTGTNDNRIDFQRMIRDSSKKEWDYILVYKLDRFSRNKYEMAMHRKTLRDNNVKILSASEHIPETPEGILMESLLEGMAEYYSAELSQKVKRGQNENRQKGLYTGGPLLYGYQVKDRAISINEDEAQIIKYIFESHASGKYAREICEELTERGIYHRDKPFQENTVIKFLKNEKYIGIYRHGDEIFTNIYPAIIPKHLFYAVRERLAANHYGKHSLETKYLLGDKLFCGYCGHKMLSTSGAGKDGILRRYYNCHGRVKLKTCKKHSVRKEFIENLVVEVTFKIFENKENLNFLADKVIELHNSKVENHSVLNILEKERDEVSNSLNNIMMCLEQGIISESTKKRLMELDKQLKELNKKISLEKQKDRKPILSKKDVTDFITHQLKQEPDVIIQLLVKKVIIYDDKVQIIFNYTHKKDTLDSLQECPFYIEQISKTIKNTKINGDDYELDFEIKAYFW